MAQNDDDRPSERPGALAARFGIAVLSPLLVASLLGIFGLWSGYVQLRSEFDQFRDFGGRFTGAQGAELARRIGNCEQRVEGLLSYYTAHQAWGRQWTRETERRIESLERANGVNGYWHRDGSK